MLFGIVEISLSQMKCNIRSKQRRQRFEFLDFVFILVNKKSTQHLIFYKLEGTRNYSSSQQLLKYFVTGKTKFCTVHDVVVLHKTSETTIDLKVDENSTENKFMESKALWSFIWMCVNSIVYYSNSNIMCILHQYYQSSIENYEMWKVA